MSAFSWSAVAFILAAIGLVVFMLTVPRLLGGRSKGLQKEAQASGRQHHTALGQRGRE